MAALTKDRATEKREGKIDKIEVAASTKIYAGSLVCRNSSGYLIPAANTAGNVFAGVANEYIDNSAGAAGDLSCEVSLDGAFKLVGASLTRADIGKRVYVSDDQTVTLTPGVVYCGILAAWQSATEAWVDIKGALGSPRERKKVSVPLPALTANTTVYQGLLVIQEKVRVMAISIAAQTKPADADGTCTLAITNYDISAAAGDNLLSAATVDLEALTNLTASDLTLTATVADLILDDGDYVYASLVNNSAAIDTNMAGGVVTIEYEPMV